MRQVRTMACVENLAPINVDSEMEEGEIVDDLSDISSEEEFLLRQRLEVLENYNNVLERKKAKHSSIGSGKKYKKENILSYDLSEVSATELEDYCLPYKNDQVQKPPKAHHRQKRKKEESSVVIKNKEHKKKTSRSKRKLENRKGFCESSEEEITDECKNRRRKLADAVIVNKPKNDKTSLSERLQKMLHGVNPEPVKIVVTENSTINHNVIPKNPPNHSLILQNTDEHMLCSENPDNTQEIKTSCEVIDICTDEDSKTGDKFITIDTVDADVKENEPGNNIQKIIDRNKDSNQDSDDDLELLRQHALKTKMAKIKKLDENKISSEDEDSDTTELRLICLKSALLKKAIEMKRKQKLQKKLSQSSNLQDDTFDHIMMGEKINLDNNTDIESVDMDIGSDGDEKIKENDGDFVKNTEIEQSVPLENDIPVLMVTKQDELEEDEDLLRARLLTSLSKNLPNLVNPNVEKPVEDVKDNVIIKPKQQKPSVIPEEKRFIINVESDSEGEHEATKNLTKMHMKLSEQVDFQQKLDMFLKSTRMEVEKKTTLPDVVQQPGLPKKNEKFVAKAVKNLPKSEQIEYKNLVKRMAELEKIKQARQNTMHLSVKVPVASKDTLKPRNVTFDASNVTTINNLEEKITSSRKHIAEESAKMLKLKEEGTKLSQRFKIVATELRNIKTAIALNKKQQRSVQNCLSKIRLHHQMLLKSSLSSTHSKPNTILHSNHINPKLQKENNPKDHKSVVRKDISIENYKNPAMLKAIKIGFNNDLKQQKLECKPQPPAIQPAKLSVEVNITNNKKVVTTINHDSGADISQANNNMMEDLLESVRHSSHPVVEKGGGTMDIESCASERGASDDYKSPLDAFGSSTWQADPNAILCPFEVCGDCKDTDCKYLHTITHST
ncbi:unnamed protein product [Arctia plantaginis]|uniref:C3H1-type domain-containing protein n=1 Tax=Arctia plantaginis TaxID=874455 RepID=A0A8S1B8X7_ARCPL|nr:unnamed protein product [Arctia plantaginis]